MTKSFSTKNIKRRCHIIDANNISLGRLAGKAAIFLQGKSRSYYYRHTDVGEYVQVINISKAKFTGRKLTQKTKYRYTGYPGGITARKLETLWARSPETVFRNIVYHMLPTNTLRKKFIKRLKFISE